MYRFLLILICFLCLSRNVYAHPPSSMTLEYKESNQSLTLTVNHRIEGRGHFIKSIIVSLKDAQLHNKTYPFQTNKKVVIFSFPKPKYEKGDLLSVEVTCNRTGPVTEDFSIDKVLQNKTNN